MCPNTADDRWVPPIAAVESAVVAVVVAVKLTMDGTILER
jgi:hypothetical protein